MYHIQKIGVFISHIFGHYQKNVCQGIIDKASEYGYTAEIFTSLDGENLGTYSIGEESILRVPNYNSLDGIIFVSGSYPSRELKEKILNHLQTTCTCPIIEIADTDYHFPAIVVENSVTTRHLTEHLIQIHHYKRICYLGCIEESFFSEQRENYYKEALESAHYPLHPTDVYRCDYSYESILAALHFFCESSIPDAVVCYNDRIALTFMEAALTEGYQIPEQIAVTGCDNTIEGQYVSPMLTTVSFPTYELGTLAVENLIGRLHGQEAIPVTTVTASLQIHNSCGCHTQNDKNSILVVQKLSRQMAAIENSILDSMNMSATLQHVTELDDGIELLEQYIRKIEHCREFYLCLYPDWDSVSSQILALADSPEENRNTNNISLQLAFRNGRRLPECSYYKKYLLPEYIYEHSDCTYIYTPLFYEEKEFGYLALAFENNKIDFPFQLIQWQMNINQMLQRIREAKCTGMLVNKLEAIYMHDSLTGLLNKHGYNQKESLLLEQAASQKMPLCAFLMDLNGLKYINDNFGHNEGDFAIQVLGHSIESTFGQDDICARFSGDEFYILSLNRTETDARTVIEQIQKYLENYNKLSSKPYNISCSIGFACTTPDNSFSSDDIHELFAQADKMMYVKKAKYHSKH